MELNISRSGGVAGMRMQWQLSLAPETVGGLAPSPEALLGEIFEVQPSSASARGADRFVFEFSYASRSVTVPESSLTATQKQVIELARTARTEVGGTSDTAGGEGTADTAGGAAGRSPA
ncbi:hypothetical protein JT358_14225 [Micrococcales bacterium 31B]|nr:hypothetical protein [Micrococcales bacterium 31B]